MDTTSRRQSKTFKKLPGKKYAPDLTRDIAEPARQRNPALYQGGRHFFYKYEDVMRILAALKSEIAVMFHFQS
jgi:hypothetical protein